MGRLRLGCARLGRLRLGCVRLRLGCSRFDCLRLGWDVYDWAVFVVLLLALLGVPLIELYVIIQVAQGLGTPETILLLIAVSVVGAWMVRRSGLGVLAQVRERLSRGELPARELVDGLLIVVAGALMLTPGFVTDAVGLMLLFMPTRLIVRSLLVRYFSRKASVAGWTTNSGTGFGFGYTAGGGPRRTNSPGGFSSSRLEAREVYEAREVGDSRGTATEGDDDAT